MTEGLAVRSGAIDLPCPGADGATLSCDATNAEPFDVPIAAPCRTHNTVWQVATPLGVSVAAPGPLTIEWLDRTVAGLDMVARRIQTVEDNSSVLVSRDVTRFLRFSRPGVAPMTMSAAALRAAKPAPLPAFQTGGEVVVLSDDVPVLPLTYSLQGPASITLARLNDGTAIAAGAPAGHYSLTPEYEGGVKGVAHAVEVNATESTVVAFRKEDVGAARFALDQDLCYYSTGLRVTLLQDIHLPNGLTVKSHAVQAELPVPPRTSCDAPVAGLRPGTYEAEAIIADGSAARVGFVVASQQVVDVKMDAPFAEVTGHVQLNGRPFVRGRLMFQRMTRTGTSTSTIAQLDGQGEFSLRVGSSGTYDVSVVREGSDEEIDGPRKRVTLVPGPDDFDWTISGGALTVDVTGWDRSWPLKLAVDTTGVDQATIMERFKLAIDETLPTVLLPLPFGRYRVAAVLSNQKHPDGDVASETEVVTLTTNTPEATVHLALQQHRAQVILRDETGAPVSGGRVLALGVASSTEIASGVYEFSALSAGTSISVQAGGFTPVCAVSPAAGSIELTLHRGAPRELQFSMDGLRRPGGSILWSDSPCPTTLQTLDYVALASKPGEGSRFLIQNFPDVPQVIWFWEAGLTTTPILPGQPIVLPVPKGGGQ